MTMTEAAPAVHDLDAYHRFLAEKTSVAESRGFACDPSEVTPLLKPHQRDIVAWAVRGGRRAVFAAFGLGKTLMQLEILRLVLAKAGGGRGLIVLPLGVRQEFVRDAALLDLSVSFIRSIDEAGPGGIYLTNYETVRDGKLDPRRFDALSLDEAGILRGLGGTKTFREFMRLFEGTATYRFVATATPSPNEFIELLAYSAFLDVMDVGQAKTRFFKRNSEKADALTLHPHKAREFWLWVASWAIFIQRPSDLGYSDDGYELPPLDVRWHQIPTDHARALPDSNGQARLFANTAFGVVAAAREKKLSLADRVAKLLELRAEDPDAHRVIWHDLEDERRAIEQAIPGIATVYGSQPLDVREPIIRDFADGRTPELACKPVMLGSGVNFQRHCAWAIYLGIGFKFADFIQSIHRLQRFLQPRPVRIDLIYTEAEAEVRAQLERKWQQHNELVANMTAIIREYGLSEASMAGAMSRGLGVERREASGAGWTLVNNDCVEETSRMTADSVDLILTSIPFATMYQYSPSKNDFGHTDDERHFWAQMDFLTPGLLRVLKPGRNLVVHVKDRVEPGGLNKLGFQTVQPFHCDAIYHYRAHGFAYLGMRTIVTDVVRENTQTYRLGWSEQCKDGTRMGVGMPEYLLLFRKPPSDATNGYADEPVVKAKPLCDDHGEAAPFDSRTNWKRPVPGTGYSRGRWQLDAHGFWRSSGDRLLSRDELACLPHKQLYRLWRDRSREAPYDIEAHVRVVEELDHLQRLPASFMLLPPHSWHPEVWTDVTRMRTLNGAQWSRGKQMHLCLARDTLILTRDGYKPIQEVQVGDLVLTHKGRWRPVMVVENTGVRPVVRLHAQGVPDLALTPDHKVWLRRSDWARERDGAERAEPGWVPAGESVRGYVNLKLPPIEPAVETDLTFWWVVGRWLADGHIDKRGQAIISVGPEKWEAFCARAGRFGGNPPHVGTALQVALRDPGKHLRRVLRACGHGAANKHMPAEAFGLPYEQASALLEGYLSGDGHYLADRQRWMASSTSKALLLGMALLIQRVYGAIASVHAGRPPRSHVIEGRTVRAAQEWVLSFDVPGDRRKKPFVLEDGAWKKVVSADEAGEMETWNLRVEEDESYTAENCVVKNCPLQFDIVDRVIGQMSMPGELVYDPFSGLGTVALRAVQLGRRGLGTELSPSYHDDAVAHLRGAEHQAQGPTLFDLLDEDDVPDEAAP